MKAAAGDPTQVAELQARIKELEMEQNLMQRELDNMSDVAQRTDNQLRFVRPMVHGFVAEMMVLCVALPGLARSQMPCNQECMWSE